LPQALPSLLMEIPISKDLTCRLANREWGKMVFVSIWGGDYSISWKLTKGGMCFQQGLGGI
jgi:hypothetical protein